MRQVTAFSAVLVALCWLSACKVKDDAPPPSATDPVGDTPQANQLPPLSLKDDTADLLLTWIDDKGDFHVVHKPEEVPEQGREKVRVVITTKEDGTGDLVYIADLRTKQPDGSYPVSSMSRAAWNELGADRRQVRLEALAPTAQPEPTAPKPTVGADGKVSAVIYGADWCKPCHKAEDYLKSLGVNVTKKDIEKSTAARAEMNEKLAKAGRMGASIPVIDVAGQLMVGFSAARLKKAVELALKPETL